MSLKSTRKIISVVLTFIFSLSMVCFISSVIFYSSFANENYISNRFVTDSMVAQCNTQMNMKFNSLEIKSSIPSRVFKTVQNDYDTKASLKQAMHGVFNEFDSTLMNESQVEYFYSLCIEYLDGNEINYKKSSVENTAREAARIYSDCVGVHNCYSLKSYVDNLKKHCAKTSMVSLLMIVFSVIFLALIYRKKSHIIPYMTAGCAASGIAIIIGAVLMLIFKTGSDIVMYPIVYQQSYFSMIKGIWIIVLLAGVAVTAASYFAFAVFKKKKAKDLEHNDDIF